MRVVTRLELKPNLPDWFQPGGRLEIMGRFEAAAELGVRSSNLTQLRGLPEPLFTLKAGRFWLASDIRAFAARRAA